MRNNSFARGLLLAGLWAGMALGGCGKTAAPGGASYLLAPELVHFGATYSGWSARWWQWAFELPVATSPWFDHTGVNAANGQTDPVWFLVGTVNASGVETRDITIPSGVALFFPLINVEWDNLTCLPPGWIPQSISGLRDTCSDIVEGYVDLVCEVDGDKVIEGPDFNSVDRWRAQSPVFSFLYPDDNWAAATCGGPAVAGFVDVAVSDGIWLMLAPMPPGLHTIHWKATYPGAPPFTQDITYNITVTP